MRLERDAVVQALRSQQSTDLLPELAAVDVPVLVVRGEHDRARNLGDARELVDEIPDAELAVLDCGHTPVETPDAFGNTVRKWLDRKVMASRIVPGGRASRT